MEISIRKNYELRMKAFDLMNEFKSRNVAREEIVNRIHYEYGIPKVARKILKNYLNIESNYSIQKPEIGKDGSLRKKAYHLRIYKKEFIRRFFENISTTKLKEEKVIYVQNWLNNGK